MADRKPIETINGVVDEKKRPLWKKIYNLIFAESIEDVRKSVLKEIVGPYIKDFFYDFFTGSIERSIYGSSKSGNYQLRGGARVPVRGGYTPYDTYHKSTAVSQVQQNEDLYDPIIVESKADGMKLIHILEQRIATYGDCPISELNECLKRIGKFTDEYYGWKSLEGYSITRISLDEYQVILPPPIQITKKGRPFNYEV